MESKYESANGIENRAGTLKTATESLMANLPIIICVLVVSAAIALEFFSC